MGVGERQGKRERETEREGGSGKGIEKIREGKAREREG